MSEQTPKLNGTQRLLEAGLLIFTAAAMFLLLALFSYDQADPGYSQTGYQTPIRNLGGSVGAYFADVFLNLFGVIAYTMPFVIAIIGWLLFQQYHRLLQLDYFTLGLKFAGFFMFYIGMASIASMNFDDIYYFSAGGIIGDVISNGLIPHLSFVGATLVFLVLFLSGFVLMTGVSLIKLVDWIGEYTILASQSFLQVPKLIAYLKEKFGTNENQKPEPKEQPELEQRAEPIEESEEHLKEALEETMQLTEHDGEMHINYEENSALEEQSIEQIRQEPFVDIDDLIDGPIEINVQEHVSDEEITAAFESVEPVEVAEPKKETKAESKEKPTDEEITLPSLELLDKPNRTQDPIPQAELDAVSRLVEEKLAEFGVKANVVGVYPGPVITRFEVDLAKGVKASKVTGLSTDIARSMSAKSVRVVEVIEGKSYIGIELPNKYRETVFFSDVISSDNFANSSSNLAMAIGGDISGNPVVADLAKMPHLLVAGTTGAGKSVAVNTMLVSMLYKSTPDDVRMIMIDPKQVELSVYNGIPHLLSEVVTDMKEAANALRWCVGEMERRYQLMSKLGVRNLKGYNDKVVAAINAGEPLIDPLWQPTDAFSNTPPTLEKLPSIVIVVDEFADMMMIVGKKGEELIARIAQKARAAGIHLILATQRPSADVITGLIKANIPTRMALRVQSRIESRIILDQQGAEQLLGMGDMFYLPPGEAVPVRVHGAFVSDDDVHAVVNDWKSRGEPDYIDEILSGDTEQEILLPGEESEGGSSEDLDPLYDEALGFVTETRRVSISSIQRKFRIGYNRAARIVEDMEGQGVVSTPGHNGAREVLAPPPVKG